jgi:hypothetical protein
MIRAASEVCNIMRKMMDFTCQTIQQPPEATPFLSPWGLSSSC